MSRPFHFKQFTVQQEHCAMKVGTDGVLLGAWTKVNNVRRVLDIGTGSGLLALMIAQRCEALIDAIDIDTSACKQAEVNFKQSPWNSQLTLYEKSIFDMEISDTYDLIVCNPPFFIDSTTTPIRERTLARHCNTNFHQELLLKAKVLLTPLGHFDVVLPTHQGIALIEFAQQHALYPIRITKVLPNPDKPAKRLLISFTHYEGSCIEEELVIELSRHNYSEEYKELTRLFYLNI